MTPSSTGRDDAGMTQPTPLAKRVAAPTSAPLPTPSGGVTWRRMTRADLSAVAALDRLCGVLDHPRIITPDDAFEAWFLSDEFDAENDTALAFDATGSLIAYGVVLAMAEARTAVRVRLIAKVHPSFRRQGIGSALLQWQEARGLQHLAASDSTLPGWLNAGVEAEAHSQRELLDAHGYTPARWWLTMARDLAVAIPEVPLPGDLLLEPYDLSRSEEVRAVINEAFEDHWGTQPISGSDWRGLEQSTTFVPELGALAIRTLPDGNTEVVGALGTIVNSAEWDPIGYRFGMIEFLGVAKHARGQRIAQALLAHTLRLMQQRGYERALLDVDVESPTGAIGLYSRLGFTELDRSVTMLKEF